MTNQSQELFPCARNFQGVTGIIVKRPPNSRSSSSHSSFHILSTFSYTFSPQRQYRRRAVSVAGHWHPSAGRSASASSAHSAASSVFRSIYSRLSLEPIMTRGVSKMLSSRQELLSHLGRKSGKMTHLGRLSSPTSRVIGVGVGTLSGGAAATKCPRGASDPRGDGRGLGLGRGRGAEGTARRGEVVVALLLAADGAHCRKAFGWLVGPGAGVLYSIDARARGGKGRFWGARFSAATAPGKMRSEVAASGREAPGRRSVRMYVFTVSSGGGPGSRV